MGDAESVPLILPKENKILNSLGKLFKKKILSQQ